MRLGTYTVSETVDLFSHCDEALLDVPKSADFNIDHFKTILYAFFSGNFVCLFDLEWWQATQGSQLGLLRDTVLKLPQIRPPGLPVPRPLGQSIVYAVDKSVQAVDGPKVPPALGEEMVVEQQAVMLLWVEDSVLVLADGPIQMGFNSFPANPEVIKGIPNCVQHQRGDLGYELRVLYFTRRVSGPPLGNQDQES